MAAQVSIEARRDLPAVRRRVNTFGVKRVTQEAGLRAAERGWATRRSRESYIHRSAPYPASPAKNANEEAMQRQSSERRAANGAVVGRAVNLVVHRLKGARVAADSLADRNKCVNGADSIGSRIFGIATPQLLLPFEIARRACEYVHDSPHRIGPPNAKGEVPVPRARKDFYNDGSQGSAVGAMIALESDALGQVLLAARPHSAHSDTPRRHSGEHFLPFDVRLRLSWLTSRSSLSGRSQQQLWSPNREVQSNA
jgi:hypothetical protein